MLVQVEETNDKLNAALAMAGRGMRVFPVRPGPAKEPMVKDWPNTATTDTATITAIWTKYPHANIGVLCDDHIVIDVDVKKGKQGLASLMDLDIDLNTFTVRTPSGGLHVYYRGPNVKNSVEQLGPGLDIRSYHGYVLGPGSTVEGAPYEVLREAGVQEASAALCEYLRSTPREPPSDIRTSVVLDTLPAVDRATHFLRDEARVAREGEGGDQATFIVAAAVKDFGISQAMAFDLMAQHWNDRCSPPWSVDEMLSKIANAYRYGSSPVGVDAPEHQFRSVDIPQEPKAGPWFHHGDFVSFEQTWLFYNTLPAVGLALVTGPTGSGKTFLITALAHALATGGGFFGVEPDDKGATLFLSAGTEGSGLEMRLAALGEKEPLPIAARTLTTSLSQPNALANLQEEIETKAAEMEARHGVPVRMVVFETLSASGLLRDENDNAEASAALGVLAAMSRRMKALFVTSHHPPKAGKGSRGAGALDGSVDVIIDIDRDGKSPIRNVDLRKARNAPERGLGSFTLQPVVLAQDTRGRDVTSCTVSMGERIELPSAETNAHGELVLSCLEFAMVDAKKVDPDVVEVTRDAVVKYFHERTHIKVGKDGLRNNQNSAFRKGVEWAAALGRLTISSHDRKEWLSPKEAIE